MSLYATSQMLHLTIKQRVGSDIVYDISANDVDRLRDNLSEFGICDGS